MSLPQIDDFSQLFLNDVALLDVRAQVEFTQGAFPQACNIPLLNDNERQQVGLCYKKRGQDKAIELGYSLVSGEVKAARLAQWADFFSRHPQAVLYCFRGGMRSKITQQWLYDEAGLSIPRVTGGYKALRQFMLQRIELAAKTMQFIILSGRTGCGKTLLLDQLSNKIDLEKLYHHRGSAFGNHVQPQPSQIDIENALAIALLKFQHKNQHTLVLEDESACIGGRRIPDQIVTAMQRAPVVLLQVEQQTRVDIIFDEYITEALKEYSDFYGEEAGFKKWAEFLATSMDKIQRRLGGKAHKELKAILEQAISQQCSQNNTEKHREWIARLLFDYYDPMYDYQLSKKQQRIIFSGSQSQVLDYLRSKVSSLSG